MARTHDTAAGRLYEPAINWRRVAKIASPVAAGFALVGWLGSKYIVGDVDESNLNAARESASVTQDISDNPIPAPEMPEGLSERDAGSPYASKGAESPISEPDKPLLSDLAVVRDGIVYPNGVDRTLFGYKYDFKDPEQFVLAVVEGINNRDERLLKSLTGGSDWPYHLFKPEGEFVGEIVNYKIVGSMRVKDYHARVLNIGFGYQGKVFKREIDIEWKRSPDGDLTLYSIDLV